jgi:hypothetical protein
LLVAVALGGALGVVLALPQRPALLRDPEPVGVVAPVWREFDDARTVQVQLARAAQVALTTPGDGRLTLWHCAPATELTSGHSVMSLDGRAVLSLATPIPLWRDLSVGDAGSDVEALQRSLVDLGQDVPIDGRMGTGTLAAFGRVLRAIEPGAPRPTVVESSRLLWLPGLTVRVSACETSVGEHVTSGQRMATADGPLIAAQVADHVRDPAAGARVLVVDGVRLALDGEWRVRSELGDLAATEAYQRHITDPEAVPLTGTVALEAPLLVASVPPGALFGLEGERGCVASSNGQALAVQVIASELGQALVTFEDAAPPAQIAVAAPDGLPCR